MEVFAYQRNYMDYVEKIQGRKLVLFGAGARAVPLIAEHYPYDDISFICDNDPAKWGKAVFNIPVCSPEKLLESPDSYVVMITAEIESHVAAISRQLSGMGMPNVFNSSILHFVNRIERYDSSRNKKFHELNTFPMIEANRDKIMIVREMLGDEKSVMVYDSLVNRMKYNLRDYTDICDDVYEHYFSDGVFEYGENEVLVDGGSFDGQDTVRFADIMGAKYGKSYCFEPDPANYLLTRKNLENFFAVKASSPSGDVCECGPFTVYRAGLHNRNADIGFAPHGAHSSRFVEGGSDYSVPAVRLDDLADVSREVTLIKMDLEGGEMAALAGAAETIRSRRPKLAICIYHEVEDLWQIPLYIKSLVPDYRLFVRHHTWVKWDSVLYATI